MNPKMNLINRGMARSVGSTPPADSTASKMMLSYQAECDNIAKAKVAEVEGRLASAQAEIAALQNQLAELSRDSNQKQKNLIHGMDDVKDVAKREISAIKEKHADEMMAMNLQLDALRKECAKECESKIRAEAERDSAVNTCKQMEQMVAKLQAAKPVAPTPQPPKPKPLLEFKVTARDENGRIVSFKQIS